MRIFAATILIFVMGCSGPGTRTVIREAEREPVVVQDDSRDLRIRSVEHAAALVDEIEKTGSANSETLAKLYSFLQTSYARPNSQEEKPVIARSLARVSILQKRGEESLLWLRRAAKACDPRDPQILELRLRYAEIAIELGRTEEALALLLVFETSELPSSLVPERDRLLARIKSRAEQ
ncbi:MAG: hypothetical protein NUW37_12425 [Planctomycetes bacterium]|nr:hypothetical protein [Planctomycetota bacterium]